MKSKKNQTTLLLLAFLLGHFGVHRFYAGRAVTGLLMLFTLGGFGIWWLIDIIFTITGEMKDSDGYKIKNEDLKIWKWLKPAGIFLLVFSPLLLIGGSVSFFSAQSFKNSAIETSGTVVTLRESISDGSTYYYPDFKFVDQKGIERFIHSSTGSNPPSYRIGDEIEVLYMQEDPNGAKENSFFSIYGLSVVLGVIGLGYLLMGALFHFVYAYLNKRAQQNAGE
tara:strand:- start:142 stop:810 length:669 start_codon:yes stop_codon:yes gene_type:complete